MDKGLREGADSGLGFSHFKDSPIVVSQKYFQSVSGDRMLFGFPEKGGTGGQAASGALL